MSAPLVPDPASHARVSCGPRVYFLRIPRLLDRPALAREIAALGGRQHGPQALIAAAIAGARALLPESGGREAVLGLLEAQRERWRALGETARATADDDAARAENDARARALFAEIDAAGADLAEMEAHLRALWPPLAQMAADNAAYYEIRAIALARLLLVGWEGLSPAFPTLPRGQRAPDDLIERIPQADLDRIAAEAELLFAPQEAQRGN